MNAPAAADAPLSYKVVEIGNVSDQELEDALNTWTAKGYAFDSLHFVTQAGSRRPTMAFLFFTRQAAGGE